jgi:hypothetical protein
MKAFTDLEQSKKLAEILPLESADMHYVRKVCDFRGRPVDGKWSEPKYGNTNSDYANYIVQNFTQYDKLPCWSLAALLEVMPYVNNIRPFNLTKMWEGGEYNREHVKYVCTYYYTHNTESDNPIDACVEMILKLKEKGLM